MNVVSLMNKAPSGLAARFRSDALLTRPVRPLVDRLLPAGATPVVVRSGPGKGLRLLIDPKHEKYYWTGAHEAPVQRAIAERLEPGETFWDVGAHVGFFSLLAGRLVGPSGRVHAFEPMPRNRERLRASIVLNGLENVAVHEYALAQRGGTALLRARESSTMWSLVPEPGDGESVSVRSLTLDEFAGDQEPPALIKVDVEGAEVDVLRGGIGLLSEHRPPVVVEFSSPGRLAEACYLLPFYEFSPVTRVHWLLEGRGRG